MQASRIVIVGGVAGGASCAARLRRLTEKAEIIVYERGNAVSFANCGLPYFVGGIIPEEKSLYVANAAKFKSWFNVDVREKTEVVKIDRKNRTILARELATGREHEVSFNALVLAPGAQAIRPPLPGIDLPGVFQMKTIPDSVAVRAHIEANDVKKAMVIGGGFIGLEMVENLVHRGIEVTVVERNNQVMRPLDPEMATTVANHLKSKGVKVVLGESVSGFEQGPKGKGLVVKMGSGKYFETDMCMLVIGVKPETALAQEAGLELGDRGGIRVDEYMRTSDPYIWAVGDAVESRDWVTGEWTLTPLAGPANRQGRAAADNIAAELEPARKGKTTKFRGTQGTAVVGVFDLTVASVGANEKTLKQLGWEYAKVYTHSNQHAGYYPGASFIDVKLLFNPKDGQVLGCQAIGREGVEKRVDVVSMLIQKRGTVLDLDEAELCYAPQYGSAKDVLNFVGMVASNIIRGDMPVAHWDELSKIEEEVASGKAVLLDVREKPELARGFVGEAVNRPLSTFRTTLHELPKDKKYYVYCQVGMRGYNATRQLLLKDYDAVNISGGWLTAVAEGVPPAKA